jgi:hypothetical protein
VGEEFGLVPGVYHYYSQNTQYGKIKDLNESVEKIETR